MRLPTRAMTARLILVITVLAGWPWNWGRAQEVLLAERTPRFLLASSRGEPLEIDVNASAALRQVVSLNLARPTVARLLISIERQTGLRFAYDRDLLPGARPVALRAEAITVAAALSAILAETGLDVLLSPGRQVGLVKRRPRVIPVQDGAIAGRVTTGSLNEPIVGAMVVVEGTRHSGTTGSDGRYRIEGIPAGTYTVRARFIGYAPLAMSVMVHADQEATADFALEKSAQRLAEVVTTGTVVPTEVKALPTPVTVITSTDIAAQRPRTVQDLFRRAVPGAVSPDAANVPTTTYFSVRGATTLSLGGQMKVLVDGIEEARPTGAIVDPQSIERIEVVRGPQAAAIYGSDAIGGVIQVFTKRGDPSRTRPRVNAEAALGVTQTPYSGYDGVLNQAYTASVQGGGPAVSYSFGGGYMHTGDWLPGGDRSAKSSPSIYGGIHIGGAVFGLDLSGRYYGWNYSQVLNPALFESGFDYYSKPLYTPTTVRDQTIGARLSMTPAGWWRHTLTLGINRNVVQTAQSRPRLTAPSDTLLSFGEQDASKTSIGYATAVQGELASGMFGSVTAGFEYWSLPFTSLSADGPNTSGTLANTSAQRTVTTNTGYFVQGQLGLRDALFLTAGLRAERNSDFGDSLRTPLSPRVGLSYVQPFGELTLKLRGSWGRAIRAPSPGQELESRSTLGGQIANPNLGPERQHGWDAGIEATFGLWGSLSATYYRQTAEDLLSIVVLQTTPLNFTQYQNLGRVRNTGVELEGAVTTGPLSIKGQYAYTRSQVEQLSPNYTGPLIPGDQVWQVPRHTAGVSFAANVTRGTNVAAGATYVGSRTFLDSFGYISCLGGTAPCRNDTFLPDRSYLISYPGFVKVNLNVFQQITSLVSLFASVDNLTNSYAYEFYNLEPVRGRITTVGTRVRL